MDTKLCNHLDKSYRQFEKLNDSNSTDYNDKTYKTALIDIYKTVYNTEQNYLSSDCAQDINDYLKHGNVELEKYESVNTDAKELQHNDYKNDVLNISSIILSVGFMFFMK